ncbi:hypothetical protein D3C78_1384530 [compost metagenome]
MTWGMGGWLLTPFLQKLRPSVLKKMRERVAQEVNSTFASQFSKEISLAQALQPEIVAAYAKNATGEKFLINPSL